MSRVSSAGDVITKKDERANSSPEPEKFADADGRGLFKVIEQLATLEGALCNILDGLKSNATHCSFFCREYWGTSASQAQLSLERLSCNERLKRQVQQACVLESLSLGVASHLCTGLMQGVSVTIRSRLRNLLYYIHENCLVLLDLVCQRWLAENPNRGPDVERVGHCPENLNLDILVRVKRYRRLRRGEHIMALRQHNEMIANVVRQLCRGGAVKQRPPLSGRSSGMSSPGDRSPGIGGPSGLQVSVLSAVNDVLSSRVPLDRLRASAIRAKMLQYMRFRPLLNIDGTDPDAPWPQEDPYERYGAEQFALDGPTIWFEPLPPMLPDLEQNPKLPLPFSPEVYTLVLDLDETLVHYVDLDGLGNYEIRPGMHEFVQRMNQLGYEIVIFTAATQDYADWVIDQIDSDHYIHHRLYRQHALPWGPIFVKDLSRIGRDLDRVLIIDNVQENFMLQPHNGIFIVPWYDDPRDTALFALTPLLDELAKTRPKVHEILDKYRDQIPTWAGFDQFSQLGGEFSELEENADHGYLPEPPLQAQQLQQQPGLGLAPEPVARSGYGHGAHGGQHGQAQDTYVQSARSPGQTGGMGTHPRQDPQLSVASARAEVSPPPSPPVASNPQAPLQPQSLLRGRPGNAVTMSQQHPAPATATAASDHRRAEWEVPKASQEQHRQQQQQRQQQYHQPPQHHQPPQQHQQPQQQRHPQQHHPQHQPHQQHQHGNAAVQRAPAAGDHPAAMPGTNASYILQRGGYPAQQPQMQAHKQPPPRAPMPQAQPQAQPPQPQVQPQRQAAQPQHMQPQPQPARAAEHRPQPQGAAMPMRPAFGGVTGPYQAPPPHASAPPPCASAWGRAGLGPHQLQRGR